MNDNNLETLIDNEDIRLYLEKNFQLNKHILINQFKLSNEEAESLLTVLKENDILIEIYYVLCSHCQSIAESGLLLEENEKMKLKNSYKCWSCKKKFNSKDAKVLQHYKLKEKLFDHLKEGLFK